MDDDYNVQVSLVLAREMRLLGAKQPKAVQLMLTCLSEMDVNNQAMLHLGRLRTELGVEMGELIDTVRAIQGMGWLESNVMDTELLLANVSRELARRV